MKTKIILIVAIAALVFGVVGWSNQKDRQQRHAWEYKVEYVPGNRSMSEQSMNHLGMQGWELVTVQPINNEGGTIGAGNYFFKRARFR